MRGRLAGSGLRPWPFFLAGCSRSAIGAGVAPGVRSSDLGPGLLRGSPREEQELIGVDPLALLAVALAQELFELVLELGVEMGLLARASPAARG